jgi:metallo-beta-lactamase class B
LINSNLDSSVPQIKASVEKLGFHFNDVKILLISHAHFDHCAGSFQIKELTAAKYMVMDADAPEIEAGGKGNFQYGKSANSLFKPVKVDRVLHDGDEVKLGDAELVAHLTPGHTKGCTTWTMKAQEGGRSYDVVIIGSMGVNPGTRLVNNTNNPAIADEYAQGFKVMHALPCDVPLGSHPDMYNMAEKHAKLGDGRPNPFIDPQGYKAEIDLVERTFRSVLDDQKKAAAQ